MVEVKTEQESSPEAGAGAGEPAGAPPAGASSVFDGIAIAVGPLETSLPDSSGTGLTVTVKAAVAVGRIDEASTGDDDSTGEPPKSVPLRGAVPFMGKVASVGIGQLLPVPVPWWKRLCRLWLG